ncbi:DNA double-strand break repair nuclease NurA [cf. Phormidesmis sp. LEGE 11477]|uniref:DNA double-strand break repair nuclease NurA n=1 Tax=cf. Phormidesmis sp. LEGE 11477 TaxID=1828680 RepID=UPI00187FDB72|nr:DNA double-strand break repair nuclease NurA [cf. Phormidesmis sp. LEGE 11477]MBE9063934.1 DNA double-strand break repair nuclease NurA [cf. Phormidesmis sp. LEGE 11477]
MLDLSKLARQMQGISDHLSQEAEAARRRVEIAQNLMVQATADQSLLTQRLDEYRDRLLFAAAEPIEPLDTKIALKTAPAAHTVLSSDGSQISPSHHEIAYCYLLNISRVIIHYGQSRYPILDSLPEVIYRAEDLYASRQWGISTEEWMGYRRTAAEAIMLSELGEKDAVPALAMTDGSLIYWFLEQIPAAARDQILLPVLAAWEQLREKRIPVMGYISSSRSGEALNFLRLQACPYEGPDCRTHCEDQRSQMPCQTFSPLRDVTLWATTLSPGERGPLWKSSADILSCYGDHTTYFCYVHVGAEVARVEFPQWVVEDSELLDSALSLMLAQVQKGFGYPVALAEAHNQAVVRGGDRTRFFTLLEQQMIRAGLKNVGTSFKEARKRGSIA